MKEHVEYCVEYRRNDEKKYHPSFFGFKNMHLALEIAKKSSQTLHARVVEQRRRVVKVFSLTSHSSGSDKDRSA